MNLIKLLDTKLIHTNLLHFYVLNNERSERGIKEAIPFSITSKRIKYLGINLLKQVKDLYENYMMLIKEMEDNSRWKDILCSWIGRINIVKINILLKTVYRFNAITIKL